MSRLDDFLDRSIYVIDTETTGLNGYPDDLVVDIAICKADPTKGTVKEVYSSVVGYDVSEWNDNRKNAWIFQNTDLSVDMVSSAPPVDKVASEILDILEGKNVSTFNTSFDLQKFLYRKPWDLLGRINECRCIMIASKNVCRLPGMYDEYKWPKLEEAYSMIVDGDPASINGNQTHRALSDAVMAAHVFIALSRKGLY